MVKSTELPEARPDNGELAALYREHYLGLVKFAVQLVDDQASAEDVVQDVFARLHGRRLADIADPRRYLATAVVNQARSSLRRRRFRRTVVFDESPADGRAAEPADARVVRNAASGAIWRAITKLPRRQHEVVVLRFYADWSIPEIAEALGISRGAASSSLDRALKSLTAPIGAIDARNSE